MDYSHLPSLHTACIGYVEKLKSIDFRVSIVVLTSSSDSLNEPEKRKWNKLFDKVKVDLWQNRHPIMKTTKLSHKSEMEKKFKIFFRKNRSMTQSSLKCIMEVV